MKVKQIDFINRAPFKKLNIDFSDKHVISLTGINGAGKTTILSYIVDALLDRLLHHSSIISIKGPSYRTKDKRALLEAQAAEE